MQDEDNVQKTLFTHVRVNSVLIQAFENEAIKQYFLSRYLMQTFLTLLS